MCNNHTRQMSKEEYDIKLSELKRCHAIELSNLNREFAFGNRKYEVGDIVTSMSGGVNMRIDKIKFGFPYGFPYPCCVYEGYQLTAKGEMRKDNSRTTLWETNIRP